MLATLLAGRPLDLRAHIITAPIVPDTTVAGFMRAQLKHLPGTGEAVQALG